LSGRNNRGWRLYDRIFYLRLGQAGAEGPAPQKER
jgi:hypothetical protein